MIYFSTKLDNYGTNDVVGGSLPQLLFADFYQNYFGENVTVIDPFYNSRELLSHNFENVVEETPELKQSDRIANPLFYISNDFRKGEKKPFDIFSNKKIKFKEIESFYECSVLDKKDAFFINIPYCYWYDLIFKYNYKPNFKYKNDLTIKYRSDNVFSIQIRLNHWKKIRGRENDPKKIKKIYYKLIDRLKSYSKDATILYYGDPDEEINHYFKDKGAINVNESSSILERAFILSYTTHSFCSINGFSYFCNYLAFANGYLKTINIINDVENFKQTIHVKRTWGKGIGENNISQNGGFFSKFDLYPRDKVIDKIPTIIKSDNLQSNGKKVSKLRIRAFSSKYLKLKFFGESVDDILIEKVCEKLASNKKINVIKDSDKPISDKELVLLTHYNSQHGDTKITPYGFDFNKPKLLNINNLGPDQFIYEDLLVYHKNLASSIPCKKKKTGRGSALLYNHNFLKSNETVFSTLVNESIFDFKINDKDLLNHSPDQLIEKISHLNKFKFVVCTPSQYSILLPVLIENALLIFFDHTKKPYIINPYKIFQNQSDIDLRSFFRTHIKTLLELKIVINHSDEWKSNNN